MVVCTRAKHENGKKKGTGEQKPSPVPFDGVNEKAACEGERRRGAQAEEETRRASVRYRSVKCASRRGNAARKRKPAILPS